jgi:hypothetical protein
MDERKTSDAAFNDAFAGTALIRINRSPDQVSRGTIPPPPDCCLMAQETAAWPGAPKRRYLREVKALKRMKSSVSIDSRVGYFCLRSA